MRQLKAMLLSSAILLGAAFSAQAALLDEFTTGDSAGVAAMSASELDAVVGEGAFEHFIEVPNLARSFERTIEFGENTLTIVAVAGSGITISASGPDIPSLP